MIPLSNHAVELDNRIFALQRTSLPEDLSAKLHEADVHFLQDRDEQAAALVAEIEQACHERGIPIADVNPFKLGMS